MQKDNRSTRAARHCCVKGCTNPPAKGRKTCCKHGKTRAARPTKTKPIHVDRVLRTWRDYEADTATLGLAVQVTRLPEETPYLAGIAVRDNGNILGLPTTIASLKELLSAWLNRPGCTLDELRQLTPARLPRFDREHAICTAASALVVYDLARGPSPALAGEGWRLS